MTRRNIEPPHLNGSPYRLWRTGYGQQADERLKRGVSDLTLDKLLFTEDAKGVRTISDTGGTFSPAGRRACTDHVRSRHYVSERRLCRVLGQHRSTQRRIPPGRVDEDRLVAAMIGLARQYGRSGYRRVAVILGEGFRALPNR
jgi:hypothetical protein